MIITSLAVRFLELGGFMIRMTCIPVSEVTVVTLNDCLSSEDMTTRGNDVGVGLGMSESSKL